MSNEFDGKNGNGYQPLRGVNFGGTYSVGPDQRIDATCEKERRYHRPGDCYVRAMLVLQEVDHKGQPISKGAAVEVTRRVGGLELAQYGGDKFTTIDLLSQHAGAALHQLIRDTAQGAIVYHFAKQMMDDAT